MSDELRRLETPLDLEVRDIERREIHVRLIPYNEQIMFRGRPESFAPGAAAHIKADEIKLLSFHDPNRPIGRGVSLEERADGLHAVFRVSKTREGDEMLELAKDGVLGVSPGFKPAVQTRGGVHTRVDSIPEASLVTFSAYPSAKVLAVREGDPMHNNPDTTVDDNGKVDDAKPATKQDDNALERRVSEIAEEIETRASAKDLDELEKRYDRLESTLAAPGAARGRGHIVPASLHPTNYGVALLEEYLGKTERRERIEEDFEAIQKRVAAGEIETRDVYEELGLEVRALADITGGQSNAGDNDPADDLSGLVVEEFMADQLVNLLNRRRPLFANVGQLRMPRSGYARIPSVSQHTLVKARGTQKSEAPSRKMIVATTPYEAEWLAGAVDIAIELRKTSSLDALALIVADLFGQYAKATELDTTTGQHGNPVGLVPFIEAGGHGFTYTESPLLDGSPTYAEFVNSVYEACETLEDATDVPADQAVLFPTREQFRTIAGFVDSTGRRIFSTVNPTNADARAGFATRRIQLPDGPTVIKPRSDDLTQAVLTNAEALKVSDGGPEQIGPVRNVGLIGDDVGVLGRTMIVPRIPAGVIIFGDEPSS